MTNINSIFSKTRTSKSLNLADLFLNMCFIHHARFHNSIFILSYWKRLFTGRPITLHLQLISEFTARYDIKYWKKTKRQIIKTHKFNKTLCIDNRYAKRIIWKYQIGKKMRKNSKRLVKKKSPCISQVTSCTISPLMSNFKIKDSNRQ